MGWEIGFEGFWEGMKDEGMEDDGARKARRRIWLEGTYGGK